MNRLRSWSNFFLACFDIRPFSTDSQRDGCLAGGNADRWLSAASNQVGESLLNIAFTGPETVDGLVNNDPFLAAKTLEDF